MNTLDEYRGNARECQRMADNAQNPTDKASWRRLAASWLGLLRNEPARHIANEPEPASAEESNRATWTEPSDKDSQASH